MSVDSRLSTILKDFQNDFKPTEEETPETHSIWNRKIIISLIFILLGVGSYLPWFVFINAEQYFSIRFCNSGAGFINSDFEASFGLVTNLSSVATLLVMFVLEKRRRRKGNREEGITMQDDDLGYLLLTDENYEDDLDDDASVVSSISSTLLSTLDMYRRRQPNAESSKQHSWIYHSFGVALLVVSIHVLLVSVPSISSNFFFFLTICSISIFGVVSAILTTELTVQSTIFPQNIGTTSYFVGLSVGGLVIAVINFILAMADDSHADIFIKERCRSPVDNIIAEEALFTDYDITQYLLDSNHTTPESTCPDYTMDYTTLYLFLTPCFILIACTLAFSRLQKLPLTLYYRYKQNLRLVKENPPERDEVTAKTQELTVQKSAVDTVFDEEEIYNMDSYFCESRGRLLDSLLLQNPNEDGCELLQEEEPARTSVQYPFTLVYPVATIFFILFCSFTLFPGWISTLSSAHQCISTHRYNNDLFMPIVFILFNFFDLIGKLMAKYIYSMNSPAFGKWLFLSCILRIFILLPLFIIPFESDFWILFLVVWAGFSNGCLINLSFMNAVEVTPPSKEDYTTTVMNLGLNLGLLCGSIFSVYYVQIGNARLRK